MSFDKTQDSYVALRNVITERTSSIVVWVGSGLSVQAGLPTWQDLKKRLLSALKRKAEGLEEADAKKLCGKIHAIERQTDNWRSFQMLGSTLGRTTYQDTIREGLRPASTANLPSVYSNLWRLRISGLVNLNIDRLATRAFNQENIPDKQCIEFNGHDAGSCAYVLKGPQPFIVNLHGIVDDTSSWVFTKAEQDQLMSNNGYRVFIQSCFTTKTVLFIGMGVDDIAVGGHLEALKRFGVDIGTHDWVTPRGDLSTDQWAEGVGVRLIRYEAPDDDHSELQEFFSDLFEYLPQEEVAPPVALEQTIPKRLTLPDLEELLQIDTERIRLILNDHAHTILKDTSSQEVYESYESFCEKYDEAIYRAWYTNVKEGQNNLFGYKLKKWMKRGAFGNVYKALSPDNQEVAIKVLLHEIRSQPEMIQSFRRGVRSMRILSQHGVKGMVPYREASEIPAFVVMDLVDGPNLGEAVHTKKLRDWEIILRIAVDLARIIRSAHLLPERVLHRDLRPSNVMLKGFYSSPDAWEVVVLDFDLSWHRGAMEKSVIPGVTTTGYLSPEQLQSIRGVSTRHAAVDSFGLGMIFFFMVAARDPVPAEHKHRNWIETVSENAEEISCPQWESLPKRFTRIIVKSTLDRQAERWDMAQIEAELIRLQDALYHPDNVEAAELAAEEITARTDAMKGYTWDMDRLTASLILPSGIGISIKGVESVRKVTIDIGWASAGTNDRRRLRKWLPSAVGRARDLFKGGGWQINSAECKQQAFRISASISVLSAREQLDEAAATVDQVCNNLCFQ